jgi:predicted esterase
LSIDNEGNDVARWLTEKGVTCFVLKYRLVECKTDDPTREMLTKGNSFREVVGATVKLAMNDGLTAIGYVRKHAKNLGVNPNRIGMIGFSAGGTLAASVAHNYTANTRPNYVAPIYLQYDWVIKGNVPSDAPPMFITAATDDQLRLADHSVRLYRDWTAAGKSAELHLFAKGGHGFGMRKQDLPTDRWIERFSDWMEVQGLLEDAQNVNVKGKQKEMSTEIPDDIQQRVVRDFGQQHADDIGRYLLERIPSGLPNGMRPRHLRCILYLAKGDREQLDRYIEMCLRDTRDVMLGAEYETTSDSKLVRKRDFNKPFDKAQID